MGSFKRKVGSNQYKEIFKRIKPVKEEVKIEKRKGMSFMQWHWIFKLLLIMGISFGLLAILSYWYEHSPEPIIISPIADAAEVEKGRNGMTASEERSTTSTVIDRYFSRIHSPLEGLGEVFYDEAKEHNYPVYLLPAVAMAESSGCLHILPGTYNCFGWGRGKIVFDSFEDGIRTVAGKLATMEHYKKFRETGEIYAFCVLYNQPEAHWYCPKILNFMEGFEKGEWVK